MQGSDILDENREVLTQPDLKPRFWRRQFSGTGTPGQLNFDIAFGIVMPILCFLFDPIVFTTSNFGGDLFIPLAQYKFLVYLFSTLSILTLSLWLILRSRTGLLSGIIAGVLLSGSVCSLLIGILILPLTILGLFFLIGVLGFTPFFTSFVYLRNSVRALNTAKTHLNQPKLTALLLSGALLAIGPPALAHWQINRTITQSMNALLSGDVHSAQSAAKRLRYVAWAVDLDQLVWAYSKETDQTRKDNLVRAYKDLTGKDIQTRLNRLLD